MMGQSAIVIPPDTLRKLREALVSFKKNRCPSPGLLDTEIRAYNYLRRCRQAWPEPGGSFRRNLREKQ